VAHTIDDFISQAVSFIDSRYQGGAIGVSGGKTPTEIYQEIGRNVRLKGATYVAVDERYVPPDHPNANALLWREILPHVLNFDTSLPITDSLDQFEVAVRPLLPLDICTLGMGPDGHTASLFPHASALDTDGLVAHTTTDHFAIHDRLTLTFPAIMQSRTILLLLRGREKRPVLTELLEGTLSPDEFPAKRLLEHPHLQILYLST